MNEKEKAIQAAVFETVLAAFGAVFLGILLGSALSVLVAVAMGALGQ